MYVQPDFINLLAERLTIFDVVSRYVPLVRQGTRYYGCCPFHNEKTPSFHLNLQKNTYICFGCKEFGNIFTFVQKLKSIDFVTAVEVLAQQAGLEIPRANPEDQMRQLRNQEYSKIMQAAQKFFSIQLESDKGKHAREYLNNRQIGSDIIKKFGIGFSGTGSQLADYLIAQGYAVDQLVDLCLISKNSRQGFYRNRLMFPIYNRQKKVIAFGGRTLGEDNPKYINSAETPLYSKSESLYGFAQALDSINRHHPIIIVEGYIDVITMHQHGFDKTVAPLGTALTPAQIKMIWKMSPIPVICFDADTAGAKAAGIIACNTLPLLRAGHSLQFATLPTTLDPDDYLRRFGYEGLKNILDHSTPLSQFLWQYLKAQYPNPIPEEKAKWHDLMTEKLLTIEHDVIRNEYIHTFKEWGYQAHEQPSNSSNIGTKQMIKIGSNREIKKFQLYASGRKKVNRDLTFQKLLLTLPLYYSEILVEIYEFLGNINFYSKAFNDIRDALLDYTNENHQNGVSDLNSYLIQRGLANLPPELSITQNYTHLLKLKETPTHSCAKEYWIEYYNKLNTPSYDETRKTRIEQHKNLLSKYNY